MRIVRIARWAVATPSGSLRIGTWRARSWALVVGYCALLGLAGNYVLCGCARSGEVSKNGDGVEHHELESLTSRIPALDIASSATWYSGTLGDDRIPGPSTYWIDAVVQIPESEVESLLVSYNFLIASQPPETVDALGPHLPSGELFYSKELDSDWSHFPWLIEVYLVPDESAAIVLITGGS